MSLNRLVPEKIGPYVKLFLLMTMQPTAIASSLFHPAVAGWILVVDLLCLLNLTCLTALRHR